MLYFAGAHDAAYCLVQGTAPPLWAPLGRYGKQRGMAGAQKEVCVWYIWCAGVESAGMIWFMTWGMK